MSVNLGIGSKHITEDIVYSDWYLPSRDEVILMYSELSANGIGTWYGGASTGYWSSSEVSATNAYWVIFDGGGANSDVKTNSTCFFRPARTITTSTEYNVQDAAPGEGWIIHKTDNGDGTFTYIQCSGNLEAVGTSGAWSNITDTAVTGTSTDVGTGEANTALIIAQAGHTDSAAKFCDDYS